MPPPLKIAIDSPAPPAIRAAREAAGLTQTAAAELIYSTLRTWQDWEKGVARMHPAFWELWRLKAKSGLK
ncbi:MAG TPA: helix-turn-helix domain-containing protein [Usitatibacteraceae bacterium]